MLHILLVEDNELDALLAVDGFVPYNSHCCVHHVTTAEDGMAFLKRQGRYARADTPSLVLLDLNLPGMSGADLLHEIRRDDHFTDTLVIALLGSANEADWWRSRGLAPDAFLTKPVDAAQVLDVWDGARTRPARGPHDA